MALEELEETAGAGNEKQKPSAETPVNDSQAETIAKLQEQVAELLRNQQQNQGMSITPEFLTNLVNSLGGPKEEVKTGQIEFGSYGSEVDVDDVLPQEQWVTFISHRVRYVIVDDKRHGQTIKAPIDKIAFKYNSTKQVKNGKETDLINLCTYTCKSKKELEWLYNHSLFGVMFFNNISDALDADSDKASRMVKHLLALKGAGQHSLVTLAKERGIYNGETDMNKIRSAIAKRLAEEEIENAKGHTERMLREKMFEEEQLK